MKRILALNAPTPGLADYLDCEGDIASWEGFRNHRAGAAYRELVETLQTIQHGLCGYCEIDIDIEKRDRQVEHVVPQSAPQHDAEHVLDHANMIVCCKGGTLSTADETRRLDSVRGNRSCGEAKENLVDPDFVDPRTLPALPSLTRVRFDGEITADEAACSNAGFDADKVNRTIVILGLNVERLQRARENLWRALNDSWQEHHHDPVMMKEAARMELSPTDGNDLHRFFTTSRSWFGPLGEDVLKDEPQKWI